MLAALLAPAPAWSSAPADPGTTGGNVAAPQADLTYLDHLAAPPAGLRGRQRAVNFEIDPVAEARRVLQLKIQQFEFPERIGGDKTQFFKEAFELLMPPNSNWLVQLPQVDGHDGALGFFQSQLRFGKLNEVEWKNAFLTAVTHQKIDGLTELEKTSPAPKPEDLSKFATSLVDVAHFTNAFTVKDVQFRGPKFQKEILDEKVMQVLTDAWRTGNQGRPLPPDKKFSDQAKKAVAAAILNLKDQENIRNGFDPLNPPPPGTDPRRQNPNANQQANRGGQPGSGNPSNSNSPEGGGRGGGMGGGSSAGGGGGRANQQNLNIPTAQKPQTPNDTPQAQQIQGEQPAPGLTPIRSQGNGNSSAVDDSIDRLNQRKENYRDQKDVINKFLTSRAAAVIDGVRRLAAGQQLQAFTRSVARPTYGGYGATSGGVGGAVGAAQSAGATVQSGRFRASRGLTGGTSAGAVGSADFGGSGAPTVPTRSSGGRGLVQPDPSPEAPPVIRLKPKFTSFKQLRGRNQ